MSTTPSPESAEDREVREIFAVVQRLSPLDREKLAWVIIQSLHPEVRPGMFASKAEMEEYLAAKPDAVVGRS